MSDLKKGIYNHAIVQNCDDLPDHIGQMINALTSALLLTAHTGSSDRYQKDPTQLDPNYSLAALQKALR